MNDDTGSTAAAHLGDGAYVTLNAYGELAFTANHHDERLASDIVVVPPEGLAELRRFLETHCPRLFR